MSCWPADYIFCQNAHNGGYFASSSWSFVTESEVVLNRQAIASGMGLWCQAYQGTLAG
jgi:hypothetical protein